MSDGTYKKLRDQKGPGFAIAVPPQGNTHFDAHTPAHSILLPLLLSPFATSLSLAQIRLLSLLAGLVGLFFLAKLLSTQTISTLAAVGCFIPAAFFFPMFPFYFLALPEVILFLLVCISFWNLLENKTERLRDFWPSIACSCLAPFVHLRGLPLTLAVAFYLIWKLGWRWQPRRSWMTAISVTGIYSITAVGVILYNLLIYGNMLGSVTVARPSFSWDAAADSFFDSHCGLLTYAPVFFLSVVGLIAGLWQRKEWSVPAGIFLVALITTSMGPNPGESYPARFWAFGVPVLSICLIGFFQGRMAKIGKAIVYVSLALISLTNTVLFLFEPGHHLAARSGPLPYEYLFEMLPGIHLGFWLGLLGNPDYLLKTVAWCIIWVALAAAASIYRSRILTAGAIILLVLGFEIHRAKPAKYSARLDPDSMAVVVEDPTIVKRAPLRLTVRASWQEYVPRHTILVSDGIQEWEQISTNNVLLSRPESWEVPLSLRVSWQAHVSTMADATAVRMALSDSWFVRLFAD